MMNMLGCNVTQHGQRRHGIVIEDTGEHCVLVRWHVGKAECGGVDGWYSRHNLTVTGAAQ